MEEKRGHGHEIKSAYCVVKMDNEQKTKQEYIFVGELCMLYEK